MDKDRWAPIAIEIQPHVEAILRTIKREKLDMVVISLYGTQDKEHGVETSVTYPDGRNHYESDRVLGGNLKIAVNGDEYKTYTQT